MNYSKKILVIGASGFVGTQLFKYLDKSFTLIGTFFNTDIKNKFLFLDITDNDSVNSALNKIRPDIIIIASGAKNVRLCEINSEETFRINAYGIKNIINAKYTQEKQPYIMYISSDYVFDGNKGMYHDYDIPNPSTVYGKSKYYGEQFLKTYSNYSIVRTSALMGVGGSFFDWLIGELRSGNNIEAYDDTFFTPTPIKMFCTMIINILSNTLENKEKIIHVSGGVRLSRYEFISQLNKTFFKNKSKVFPIGCLTNDSLFQFDLSLVSSKQVLEKTDKSFENYLYEEIV